MEIVRRGVKPIDAETALDPEAVAGAETAADSETATVRERVTAYLVDAVVVVVGVTGVAVHLGDSGREQVRLGGLLGLVVANLYHLVLEGTGGQTVGKRVVGISVVADDGSRCSYSAAGTRTLFRFVDWLPVGYLAGFASTALTERRQRLGDLVADTVVVRTGDADERGSSRNGAEASRYRS